MLCPLCGKKIKKSLNKYNKLIPYFECEECGKYYIEPPFLNKMEGFKNRYGEEMYKKLLNTMKKKTMENIVVFVNDFEEPIMDIDEAIYLEIQDLTNELKIFFEDCNCNEYGD